MLEELTKLLTELLIGLAAISIFLAMLAWILIEKLLWLLKPVRLLLIGGAAGVYAYYQFPGWPWVAGVALIVIVAESWLLFRAPGRQQH